MRTIVIDVRTDLMGFRELRCTVVLDNEIPVVQIRGGLGSVQSWLEEEPEIRRCHVDITICSPIYTRNDILFSLATFMVCARDFDCKWAIVELTDSRLRLMGEELNELLDADRYSTEDRIYVSLDEALDAKMESILKESNNEGYDYYMYEGGYRNADYY